MLAQEPQQSIRTPEAPFAAGEGLHGTGAWGSNPNLPDIPQGIKGLPCRNRQVRGHPDCTISNVHPWSSPRRGYFTSVLFSSPHSLIKFSFQGCPNPNVHTSVFKLWLGDHMVTHWCVLQLPHAHLTSDHSLGCSSCPSFSLAILPSGWTEEVSQILCKTRKMEKRNLPANS